MIRTILESALGLSALDEMIHQVSEYKKESDSVFGMFQKRMGISFNVSTRDLRKIPRTGPLIVVANHPTGALDGIVLMALLDQVRDDVRSMGHMWFQRWPAVAERMFLVNPQHCSDRDKQANKLAAGNAVRWLRQKNVLVVFPAGEVAGWNWRQRRTNECRWKPGVALMAKATGATILPVQLSGCNSLLFRFVSQVHRRLGAFLLAKELLNKKNNTMGIQIGDPIFADELRQIREDPEVVMAGLRETVLGIESGITHCDLVGQITHLRGLAVR